MNEQNQKSFDLSPEAVIVIAHVRARGGKEKELQEATKKLVPLVQQGEDGCLFFQAHSGYSMPGLILFYEVFENIRAFETHKTAAHTEQWFRDIEPLAAEPVEVTMLQIMK